MRSKEKEKTIGTTTAQIMGIALHSAMAQFFVSKLFDYAYSSQWERFSMNLLALGISLYFTYRLATRIAEKLEK